MQTRARGIAAVLVPIFFWMAAGVDALAEEKTVALPSTGLVNVGDKAPVLSTWDLENNLVRLAKILEEPDVRAVMVSFYASWCKECHKGLAILGRERERLGKAGVRVLLVNHGEDARTVQAHRERAKLTLPIVTDEFKEIGNAYGVRLLPVSFLVGKDSTVKAIYTHGGKDYVERILQDAARNK